MTSTYILWLVLALPGLAFTYQFFAGTAPGDLLHGTGESSARMMIIAMMARPLRTIFPNTRWIAWLRRRRRAFGVAAFVYAVLHTVFYLADMGALKYVLAEITALSIWTGWVALLVFIPLAVTSNDASVRALGTKWGALHKTIYVAAVMTLLHWLYIHDAAGPSAVHFGLLLAIYVAGVIVEKQKVRKSKDV